MQNDASYHFSLQESYLEKLQQLPAFETTSSYFPRAARLFRLENSQQQLSLQFGSTRIKGASGPRAHALSRFYSFQRLCT